MSLRWRIMASIVFVILLTVVISVAVGYCTSQSRLGVFVDEIGDRPGASPGPESQSRVHHGRWLANGGPAAV